MLSWFTKFKYHMSNILIIKHGSLGDIAQISGVLRDIKEEYRNSKIFILTTPPYRDLLNNCPYLDEVLIDRRLPRWNIIYLIKLKKLVKKFNFKIIFDLQNSSRTSFYRKYLFNISDWCSTETILKNGERKKDFDKDSVLKRFKMQLELFKVNTNYTLKPDFSWAATDIDKLANRYFKKKFILLFPFCSPQLSHKKWPYYNQLIDIIKSKHENFEIATVPGPQEINDAKEINSIIVTNNKIALNIMELAGLIKKSSYIISNDTGPAHISAHMKKSGIAIFGKHTTPEKVSIETENFKTINVEDLKELKAEVVYEKVRYQLSLIN
jgi:ADP-heptose:LPS heptosyltransferase